MKELAVSAIGATGNVSTVEPHQTLSIFVFQCSN